MGYLQRFATYAADVFSDALNQPNSALQHRLVDSGLFQSIGVNYYTLDQVGPITISGQTTPARLKEALQALYAQVRAGPGTPQERVSRLSATLETQLREWATEDQYAARVAVEGLIIELRAIVGPPKAPPKPRVKKEETALTAH